MIKNYIKVAFRSLLRNKFHAAINVTGLAIGVSACLIIYLIVSFELSFNKDIKDYDRIYRIHSQFTGTFSGLNRGAPTAVAAYVRDNFKGVESATLFFGFGSDVIVPTKGDDKTIKDQETVIITGADYFTVIDSYEWVIGSPDVLTKPKQVVLTESQAKKYFGDGPVESFVGKELIYRDSLATTVAGVVRDLPFHTDFEFTDFISAPTIEASWLKKSYRLEDWASTNSSTQVFLKASPGTTLQTLQEQLPQLSKKYAEYSTWAVNAFNAQPLADLHFNVETGIFDPSRDAAHLPTLITLIFVAILLLVIAAINFINLETAQAVRRAKEVGVRKVLGSTRTRLVMQFLCEGFMITLIAIILAVPLTELGLMSFSEFVPKGVELSFLSIAPFLLFTVAFIGLLASAYPAFVLSSFLPAMALKNQAGNSNQSRTAYLRKMLIVFQFSFAQVLIIGTLVVGWQIRYMLNKDLGFKKDAVVYFYTPWHEKKEKTQLLINELEKIPQINDMSLNAGPPSENGWSSSNVKFHDGYEEISVNAYRKFGDVNYLKFFEIELLAGRNLLPSDTVKEFLINETMLASLGFEKPEEAIGAEISYGKGKKPVVGVVKDFHTRSLHTVIDPVMLSNEMKSFSGISLRFATANETGPALKEGLSKVEAAWKKIYPDEPFEPTFLDETLRNFYKTEQRTSKMVNTAMALAIFISCLGLFGLASFTATQRTKEIGIRKVLGASVQQIVMLLSKDFIVLVLIAFVIAAPVAWYAAGFWLEGFSYRTTISPWMLVATVLGAVLIAFVTVSYQTLKAANANPADTLKTE